MGIVMRARSPRDVDRLPSLRGRGALPVLLSRRRRHVLTLTLGRFFSGLKRLRIFGERRSLLEISRRREEHFPPPRVQVSDSSIVIMVASRREMYMYSKKKKSALFYTRRKVAWHSLNHHHKVGDRRTLGESERAFREAHDGADATPTTTATPLPRGPS